MHTRTNQREVTQKIRKGDQSFLNMTRSIDLIHIAIVSSRYSIRLPSNGMHKDCVKKNESKGSNSETKKCRAIFLYATCYKVSSRYAIYAQGQSKVSSKGSNSEIEKGIAIFFCT